MKTIYKAFGILAVTISLLTCITSMMVFQNKTYAFSSGYNYWILQSSELGLMIISLLFAFLLFKPNPKLTNRLLWVTVIILIVAIGATSDNNSSIGGLACGILSVITGVAVFLAGFFSSLLDKDDVSFFYQDFRSKLDL